MLKNFQSKVIPFLGIFLLFFYFFASDVLAIDLNEGLIAYYPFNGNVQDVSGNNYHGTNYGANSGVDKFGNPDGAYNFFRIADNRGDYVTIPVNINPDTMNKITIISWVKQNRNNNDGAQAVISNDNHNWDRSIFSWHNDGFGIVNGSGLVGYHPVVLGDWYFLAGIYDQEVDLVELYVNKNKYSGYGRPDIGTDITNIGRTSRSTAYFDGSIDEVRIYNRVLSEAEINALYEQFLGEGEPEDEDFSFAHMTDIHLGSSWVPGHRWYEELSYPRFTDALYEIGRLGDKPDFILVSGDVVEYAREDWLSDYRSLTESFTAQSGVRVYTVPGNHDRYLGALGSAPCIVSGSEDCQDGLATYVAEGAGEENLDFLHKGIQFIGLDSGADFMGDLEIKDFVSDRGIESVGISTAQLMSLAVHDTETPKVLFMHAPVFTGSKDECDNEACPQALLEDGSFVNNRDGFMNWAADYNLKLALGGHGHRDETYDRNGYLFSNIENAETYPLFVQTQSATHDSGVKRGYRLIEVADGEVRAQSASEAGEYLKYISRVKSNHELRVYESADSENFIGPKDKEGISVPFFAAEKSRRVIAYDLPDKRLKVAVLPEEGSGDEFELDLRAEGIAYAGAKKEIDRAYRLGQAGDKQFAHFHLEDKIAGLNFRRISLAEGGQYRFTADWENLCASEDIDNLQISKEIIPGLEYNPDLTRIKHSYIAQIFSPVELLAVDMDTGERTGTLEHEEYEEIPLSLNHKERERVLLYFDAYPDERNIAYYIKGVEDIFGLEEDKFGLRLDYRFEDEIIDSIELKNMPILAGMVYRIQVDWENLSDTRGVIIEVDEDGDEEFEIRFELGRIIDLANPRQIRLKLLEKLDTLKGESRMNDAKIDKVVGFIKESLNPKYWENDYYLSARFGDNVFKRDLNAILSLHLFLGFDFLSQNKHVPPFVQKRLGLSVELADVFSEVLDELFRSDALLARIAVNGFADKAFDRKAEKKLEIAEDKIEKAESLPENLKRNDARRLEFFRQAWRFVN